jgi:hypothetical protein
LNPKSKPLGEIHLVGWKVEPLKPEDCNGRENAFKLSRKMNRNQKVFFLSAKSPEERDDWMAAIESVSIRVVSLPTYN